MQAESVAVISDVHANTVALAAVLAEVESEGHDLYVFGGDLTWGPLPDETYSLLREVEDHSLFIRGNGERTLSELAGKVAAGDTAGLSERERWMSEHHTPAMLAFLETFVPTAAVEIAGLGPVRFCHGSPRSDEELITFRTPAARFEAAMSSVSERILVSAHTHLQFDRPVGTLRSINPGSVGMAYEASPGGAYWAVLGPDVALRRTAFDVEEAARRYRTTDDPLVDAMVEYLFDPPGRDEVAEHAESLQVRS
jgi:predicted phosphodiesterase